LDVKIIFVDSPYAAHEAVGDTYGVIKNYRYKWGQKEGLDKEQYAKWLKEQREVWERMRLSIHSVYTNFFKKARRIQDLSVIRRAVDKFSIRTSGDRISAISMAMVNIDRWVDEDIKNKMKYIGHSFMSDLWNNGNVMTHELMVRAGNDAVSEDLGKLAELSKLGVCNMLTLKDICVVYPFPKSIVLQGNVLSNDKDAAVQWRDGNKLYVLNGVRLDYSWWKKIVSGSIGGEEFLNILNTEVRSIVIRYVGLENLLKRLKHNLLDEYESPKGKYRVIEVDLRDDGDRFGPSRPARFVQVVCPTTGKETFLRVDPRLGETESAIGAIAWTFRMTKKEYSPLKET
jgi:hypothetical protein